jgi:hypothetical protein
MEINWLARARAGVEDVKDNPGVQRLHTLIIVNINDNLIRLMSLSNNRMNDNLLHLPLQ